MKRSPRSMAAEAMMGGGAPAEDPMAALGMPPMDPAMGGGMPPLPEEGGLPPGGAGVGPAGPPDLDSSLAGVEEALAGVVDEAAMAEIRDHLEAIRSIADSGSEQSTVEPEEDLEAAGLESDEPMAPEEEGDKRGAP